MGDAGALLEHAADGGVAAGGRGVLDEEGEHGPGRGVAEGLVELEEVAVAGDDDLVVDVLVNVSEWADMDGKHGTGGTCSVSWASAEILARLCSKRLQVRTSMWSGRYAMGRERPETACWWATSSSRSAETRSEHSMAWKRISGRKASRALSGVWASKSTMARVRTPGLLGRLSGLLGMSGLLSRCGHSGGHISWQKSMACVGEALLGRRQLFRGSPSGCVRSRCSQSIRSQSIRPLSIRWHAQSSLQNRLGVSSRLHMHCMAALFDDDDDVLREATLRPLLLNPRHVTFFLGLDVVKPRHRKGPGNSVPMQKELPSLQPGSGVPTLPGFEEVRELIVQDVKVQSSHVAEWSKSASRKLRALNREAARAAWMLEMSQEPLPWEMLDTMAGVKGDAEGSWELMKVHYGLSGESDKSGACEEIARGLGKHRSRLLGLARLMRAGRVTPKLPRGKAVVRVRPDGRAERHKSISAAAAHVGVNATTMSNWIRAKALVGDSVWVSSETRLSCTCVESL